MKGFDIYKKAMLLLGYNDIVNNPPLQIRFEEQGAELISQIAADLQILDISSLSSDLVIDTVQAEALIYGTAMLLSLTEGDTSKNRVFTELYNAKRAAALKKIGKITDIMPHAEVDGQ